MAGGLPQRPVEHLRRVDLDIARRLLAPAHIGDQRLEQSPALRMPEDRARPLLLEMEQVHLAAEAAMIALLGFLDLFEIGVEFVLLGESRRIDALKHRLVGIAAPIGAGDLHQLERIADLAGRGHMRAAAEIEPVALLVDFQILIRRNGVDQFDLEGLAVLLEPRPWPDRATRFPW